MNHTKSAVIQNRKTTALWAGLSFVLPAAVVCVILAVNGITPFGNATLVTEEGLDWFENFCRLVESIVAGDGVFYHLNVGFGRSFYTEFASGQCSPFLFAALFFSSRRLAAAYSVMTVLRAGCAGLFVWLMLDKCAGHQNKPLCFALACGYALCGFMACAAWYPSIADGAVFFPLVIRGVYIAVNERKPVRLFLFAALFFVTCPRLLIGGVVMSFFFYFAFTFSRKEAVLSLYQFAMFAATLLCAAGTAALLVVPLGAAAVDYKEGLFSRVAPVDLLGTLCFGGYGTDSAVGTDCVCLAGLLLMGLFAYLLDSRVCLYERILIGGCAVMTLLASAVPVMGSILYGFCAYGAEKVNMGFVLAAVAVYATARHFAEHEGIRLWKAGIAAGLYVLVCVVSVVFRGTGIFEVLAEAGLAVACTAVFMMLSYEKNEKNHGNIRPTIMTAAVLVLFGGLHYGAAVGHIHSAYRADVLTAETAERIRVNGLVADHEEQTNRAMRFFRRRSVDDAAADGVSLRRNQTAGLEDFAGRLGVMSQSEYGGGENFTPLTDILFGVGYVVENGQVRALDNSVQSPAYAVRTWREDTLAEGNAFAVQNRLAADWFGVDTLFVPAAYELTERTDSAGNARYQWTFGNETTDVAHFTVDLRQGDSLYLLAEEGSYQYAVGDDSRSHWKNGCRGGIYTLCEDAPEGRLSVYLSADSTQGIPAPTFAVMAADTRGKLVSAAQAQGGDYISRRGSTVNFMLTLRADGMAVTSLPYEGGWQITVNGQRVAPVEVCGGLIGLELHQGDNSVVMQYTPPFFGVSVVVSTVLAVIGLYITLYTEHEITRRRKVRMAFRAVEKQLNASESVTNPVLTPSDTAAEKSIADPRDP